MEPSTELRLGPPSPEHVAQGNKRRMRERPELSRQELELSLSLSVPDARNPMNFHAASQSQHRLASASAIDMATPFIALRPPSGGLGRGAGEARSRGLRCICAIRYRLALACQA